jgi:hypothetical protein
MTQLRFSSKNPEGVGVIEDTEDALSILQRVTDERDRLAERVKVLTEALEQAMRYIEVRNAYRGAMTAPQVEQAIINNKSIARIEIGANSCNTLAIFEFDKARSALRAKEEA